MSCHTWAYRKIKPEEESNFRKYVKEELLADYRLVPDNMTEEEHVNNLWEKHFKSDEDVDNDISLDELKTFVKKGNKKIKFYLQQIDTCSMKTLEKAYKFAFDIKYKFYKGNCYIECGFDRPVRIYGYQEEKFTDAKKFIEWIKNKESELNKPICTLYTENGQKTGFSEDVEKAVYDFWNKYDGNVLVEFG